MREALEYGREGDYQVLVSDIGLPDGSGHQIMEELKRSGSVQAGVAVSGFGMEEDVRRCREAGFDEHLTKPVAAQRLKVILEQIAARLEQPST